MYFSSYRAIATTAIDYQSKAAVAIAIVAVATVAMAIVAMASKIFYGYCLYASIATYAIGTVAMALSDSCCS